MADGNGDVIRWDPGTTVYHYTSLETGLEHILPSREVRMSPLSRLNDPKDAKARNLVFSSTGEGWGADQISDWASRYELLSGELSQVFCCVLDSTDSDCRIPSGSIEGRGFALPAMWSHYGSAHRGMCLAFDRERLKAAFDVGLPAEIECFVEAVKYEHADVGWHRSRSLRTDAVIDMEDAMIAHLVQYRRQLFFSKALDWSYERELRYLAIGVESEVLCAGLGEALRGVIVGEEFPRIYHDSLKRAIAGLDVDTMQMSWHGGVPDIFSLDL